MFLSQPWKSEAKELSETVKKLPLAQELFPDAQLLWSKSFQGKMIDIKIAKKSGHTTIGIVQGDKGYVYLFSPEGKLLWMKENLSHSVIKKCYGTEVSISDNGETIAVKWSGDYEQIEVQVYDITGKKLFANDHGMEGIVPEVSPEGEYIIYEQLLDRNGKVIALKDILKGQLLQPQHQFAFLSDKEIVILFDNSLYLFSFPERKLKWKKEILSEAHSVISFEKNILVIGDSILYWFNKDGELIWKKELNEDIYASIASLSQDGKYLAIYGLSGTGKIILLDTNTGEIKVSTPELESHISRANMICLNEKVLLSGYTGGHARDVHKGYWSYILCFDENWHIKSELWKKGLIMGSSTSSIIGVYESDATGKTKTGGDEGVFGYENSTTFTLNILKTKGI